MISINDSSVKDRSNLKKERPLNLVTPICDNQKRSSIQFFLQSPLRSNGSPNSNNHIEFSPLIKNTFKKEFRSSYNLGGLNGFRDNSKNSNKTYIPQNPEISDRSLKSHQTINKFLKSKRSPNFLFNNNKNCKTDIQDISNSNIVQINRISHQDSINENKTKETFRKVMKKMFTLKSVFKSNPFLQKNSKDLQSMSVLKSNRNSEKVEESKIQNPVHRRGIIMQNLQTIKKTDFSKFNSDDLILFKRTFSTLKNKSSIERETFTELFHSIKQNKIFHSTFNTKVLENELNKIHFDAIRTAIPEFILFVYLFLAKQYFAISDYTKSREYSKKAITLAFQINFPRIATKIYKRLIKIHLKKQNFKQAASNVIKLLYFSWFLNNKELEIDVYDKLGLVLYYLGKTREAKYYHDLNCLGKIEPKNSEYRKLGIKKVSEKIRIYRNKDMLDAFREIDSSYEDYEVIVPKELSLNFQKSPNQIMKTHLSLNRDIDRFAEYENWQVLHNNKNQKFHGINFAGTLLKNIERKIKRFQFRIANLEKYLIDKKIMENYDLEMKKANETSAIGNFSENILMLRMARDHKGKRNSVWK